MNNSTPLSLVSTHDEYEHLFAIYVPIAVGVFAAIVVLIGVVVLRFRGRPPDRAARWYEHNRAEGSYAAVLTLVATFLLYLTFSAEHRVDTVAAHETPKLIVNVTAAKWEWQFVYPAYHIDLRSGTVGRQTLVVPTGEPIRFELASADVIHSFWVPELDFKRDLIPGSVQSVTLTFTRPGIFAGQCAEFCGLRHADMVFTVDAVRPAAFRAWAQGHRGQGAAP